MLPAAFLWILIAYGGNMTIWTHWKTEHSLIITGLNHCTPIFNAPHHFTANSEWETPHLLLTLFLYTSLPPLWQSWNSIVSKVIRLWSVWYGVAIQAGATDLSLLQNFQIRSRAHSTSYLMVTISSLRGVQQPLQRLTTHLHLASRLGMSGAITTLPLYVLLVCIGTTLTLPSP